MWNALRRKSIAAAGSNATRMSPVAEVWVGNWVSKVWPLIVISFIVFCGEARSSADFTVKLIPAGPTGSIRNPTSVPVQVLSSLMLKIYSVISSVVETIDIPLSSAQAVFVTVVKYKWIDCSLGIFAVILTARTRSRSISVPMSLSWRIASAPEVPESPSSFCTQFSTLQIFRAEFFSP